MKKEKRNNAGPFFLIAPKKKIIKKKNDTDKNTGKKEKAVFSVSIPIPARFAPERRGTASSLSPKCAIRRRPVSMGLPEYQAMTGSRDELTDTVIAAAWRSDGTMAGFCSTVILTIAGVGDVEDLGSPA